VKLIISSVVAVIVLVGVGLAMFNNSARSGGFGWQKQPQTTAVRVFLVEEQELIESISAPGEIVPHTKVDISAQTMARIIELPFRQGDDVKAGDIVVRLDDRDLAAALESARARRDGEMYRLQADHARLLSLQTSLVLARRTLERQQSLYESNDISRSALDEAEQRVEDLEAQLQASEHSISQTESALAAANAEIRRAEEALRNTIIESPISGRVTKLNAEVGEMVVTGTMNNPGTVIMTIADLSRMMMEARVSEHDIAGVSVGQPAKVYIIAYPDRVFEGTVSNIALQRTGSPDGTGHFETEIDITLDGQTLLRSGLNANADIEIGSHHGIVVPSQAIVDRLMDDLPLDALRDDSILDRTKLAARVVYRVVDGKALATPVRIGASDLTHTLVTAGLNVGDEIIIGPYKVLAEIKHNDPVRDMDAPIQSGTIEATAHSRRPAAGSHS
jgi:HlyD family secretion protein